MSFHWPSINARAPACSTKLWRADEDLPNKAGPTFRLSRAEGGAAVPDQRRERRQQIDLADERVGAGIRRDLTRPADDHGYARPAIVVAVLAPAKRTRRLVVPEFLHRLVAIPVVDDRPVVARKHDDRVLRQAPLV